MAQTTTRSKSLTARYGAWAVVAGASEGLGAAFAERLGEAGFHLILLARREPLLASLATGLRARHGVEVRTLACDLADPSFASQLAPLAAELDVGLAVYNAAYSFVGSFVDRPVDDLLRVVDVNVRGPLLFARTLCPAMVARGRGALVLMSSLAGAQGAPGLAAYAASKAFNTVLGESLWGELRPRGVDVVTSCAGAIRTPGYAAAASRDAPGTLDASAVVDATLAALGGGPTVVPGAVNKLAAFAMQRLLPRARAIAIMRDSVSGLA